jgi:hypothetical protein
MYARFIPSQPRTSKPRRNAACHRKRSPGVRLLWVELQRPLQGLDRGVVLTGGQIDVPQLRMAGGEQGIDLDASSRLE